MPMAATSQKTPMPQERSWSLEEAHSGSLSVSESKIEIKSKKEVMINRKEKNTDDDKNYKKRVLISSTVPIRNASCFRLV